MVEQGAATATAQTHSNSDQQQLREEPPGMVSGEIRNRRWQRSTATRLSALSVGIYEVVKSEFGFRVRELGLGFHDVGLD